jgi:L-malate glycosyltransferase
MKILQLIQRSQLRGAEVFACQLSAELNAAGHESVIVPLFSAKSELPFEGRIISLDLDGDVRLFDFNGWKKLARLIDAEKPDVVQANAGDTLKYAILSKLIFRWHAPVVFRNASTMSLYLKSVFVKRFNGFLLSRVARVASVSEFSRSDLVRLFPFLESKIEVVPIGLEGKMLSLPREKMENYIIHVGGFTYEKNHEGLLRIMRPIFGANPAMELWLVGDGPLRPKIKKIADESEFSGRIRFLGFRSDAARLIARARLLVLPSIIEGLPAVVLEAMACRVPVVAYGVGGVSEIVISGETGWLVAKGDEKGFGEAISEVLTDNSKAGILAANAFERIVGRYMNSEIAKKFLSLYQQVAET